MTQDGGTPFDDVRDLIYKAPAAEEACGERVREALLGMGKVNDYGRLGEAAAWLASWQRRFPPRIEKPLLAVFAGAHGLVDHGVSESSNAKTRDQIEALKSGAAPLSAIAASAEADIRVFELGLESPTPSIDQDAAMTERECAATMAYGFEALAAEPDLLAVGVAGAGVGTAAAAVACALYGGAPDYWVRPGPGTPSTLTKARADLVSRALALHRGRFDDPLEALRRLGGRELAACAGAIIAARHQGAPVVLDGFATTIAAGVVHAIRPGSLDHVMAAHVTRRPAHEAALERIGLTPLLQLEFQTGAGLGSASAIPLLRTACAPFIARLQEA